jgi:hypothetical protein
MNAFAHGQLPAIPSDINVAGARLPQVYEAAKDALANCVAVDECVDWADKAAALASYARQANDLTLLHHAQRIQGRAVRRCGELLKAYDGRPDNAERQKEGDHRLPPTRSDAAREAGLSEHQAKTAVRVANIPAQAFERAVESETPPTVTALADMGRQRREPPPEQPAPAPAAPQGFSAATHALGVVAEFAAFCRDHDPLFVAGGVHPTEASEARADVAIIDAWLDRFVVNMKG